ncbi:unnamed protein product [Meloidogyne enterolobii]|uniref:Uncharacterized protein n=1 Tax=Meloidogyne enterolobii TaxID=390850 RepID=A0ACB0ZTA3_MELEN
MYIFYKKYIINSLPLPLSHQKSSLSLPSFLIKNQQMLVYKEYVLQNRLHLHHYCYALFVCFLSCFV